MEQIILKGPGLKLSFLHDNERIALMQMEREDGRPLLSQDAVLKRSDIGIVGNPFLAIITKGEYAGNYGMDTFHISHLKHDDRSLLVYLKHDSLPLLLGLWIEVEGHVSTWRGQLCWNGEDAVEIEMYYPLFSRICFQSPEEDRALFPSVSGLTLTNPGEAHYQGSYPGGLSAPCFLYEGGNSGITFLDDNRADCAADPGASVHREYLAGNEFMSENERLKALVPNYTGPYAGIRHTRLFRSVHDIGLTDEDMKAELRGGDLPMEYRGDTADLGPVQCYLYKGGWRVGADWLREKRAHLPFRISSAKWYRSTTFIGEDMGDDMVRHGETFHDFPKILTKKQSAGADLFSIPGFHDSEILGQSNNWQNRGDYYLAAQNLGGFDAVRKGVEAIHRQGGRVLYYVEGLIVWKRSRIGKTLAKEWALMREDGAYDEHYRGFWHMCPSCEPWRNWLADTCAEIIKSTGVDGFFIDSCCATHFHRCFNPAHNHSHPDTWGWGLRQMLRQVREAVDSVNPQTVLFAEGAWDIAREYMDGFISHSHFWNKGAFTVPLVRYIYPEMRAFESWGYGETNTGGDDTEKYRHIWNSVTGHFIYSHNSNLKAMEIISLHTRRVYNSFPEITQNPMSAYEMQTENCMAEMFEGLPRVVTIGNLTNHPVNARACIPAPAGVLFDRMAGVRVPVQNEWVELMMEPWEFRAFEIRV